MRQRQKEWQKRGGTIEAGEGGVGDARVYVDGGSGGGGDSDDGGGDD